MFVTAVDLFALSFDFINIEVKHKSVANWSHTLSVGVLMAHYRLWYPALMVSKAVNWKLISRPVTFHYYIIWSHVSLILRVWPLVTGALLIFFIWIVYWWNRNKNAAGKTAGYRETN
jgi:hypothetical protein